MIEGISLLWLWAILVGAIIAIFRIMEDTATPDAKRKVADWIKSVAAKSVSQTVVESPRWFIEAFDRIFGDRHLTRRCFLRSCVASIMAVFVMTIGWVVLDPTSWREYLSLPPILFPSSPTIEAIFFIFVLALMLNLLPDYISLLETRWILHLVVKAGIRRLIVLLILDVIITGGIFAFGVAIIFLVLSNGSNTMGLYLSFMSACIQFTPLTQGDPIMGIFFYSTYFTSVWFYLFVAASVATKLLYSFGRIGDRMMALLDVEAKPFQSMGLITVGLLTLAFAISAIMGAIG